MAAKLVVAPEAELDVIEAYAWYESRRVGLGEEFLTSVDAFIERIRRQPAIYPRIHEEYRRALIPTISIRRLLRVRGNGSNGLCRVSHLPGPAEMAPAPPLICNLRPWAPQVAVLEKIIEAYHVRRGHTGPLRVTRPVSGLANSDDERKRPLMPTGLCSRECYPFVEVKT